MGLQLYYPFSLKNQGEWGWRFIGDSYEVLWIILPKAAKICQELIPCSADVISGKGSKGLCKCVEASLKCTVFCNCSVVNVKIVLLLVIS